MNNSTVTSKGQITIPIDIRNSLNINPGDEIKFAVVDDQILIKPIRKLSIMDLSEVLPKPNKKLTIEELNKVIENYDRD